VSGKDQNAFWLVLLVVAGASLYFFWYAFKVWRENRVVCDTPTSRVRSAAQGYVELSGRGLPPPQTEIKGPLTRKPCTWWRYKIEERGSFGRSRVGARSRTWHSIDSGTCETPFILDDGTGQCMVDPRGAEVFPLAKDIWYGATEWPEVHIPDGTGIFGKLADLLLTGGRYRYTEYRLQPQETVFAVGAFESLGGAGVDDPEAAMAQLLRDWKQDQKGLVGRFDRNHDGKLDSEEWEEARETARRQVQGSFTARPPTPRLHVLAKPADGRAFLLSAANGDVLARRLRRRAGVALAASIVGCAVVAWMLAHS
jgi:hypothetical protein